MRIATAAAAALLATAVAGQASAAILVATWTGTVTPISGEYTSRLGFAPLTLLGGKAFTAEITYDSERGKLEAFSPGESRVGGDIAPFTQPGPVLSAWFQIEGGNRLDFDPHTRSQLRSSPGVFTQMSFQQLTGAAGLDQMSFTAMFPGASGDLDTPLAKTTTFLPGTTGSFQFVSFDPTLGFDRVDANGGLQIASLTITTRAAAPTGPSAAPEPAAWGLVILGFGAAGTMMRRRRIVCAA